MPRLFLGRLTLLAFGVLAACSSSPPEDDADVSGGQTGEESFGCLPVERDAIALAAQSSLGFSAAQVLAALGDGQTRTLTYANGGTTPLQLALEYTGGSVAFVNRELRSDASGRETAGAGAEIAIDCGDVLELDLTLTFASADGAFDEAWPVALSADTAGTARVFYEIELDALSGSFSPTQVGAASSDQITALLDLNLVGMTWTGALSGQREEPGDADDPDSVVSSTDFPIATF